MTEHLTLSHEELDRLQTMTRVAGRRLSQRRAAELLGLTERQVRRLRMACRLAGSRRVTLLLRAALGDTSTMQPRVTSRRQRLASQRRHCPTES